MGDAPKEIEENILKEHPSLDIDILKVGHHGSNTSSGKNFLKAISPKLAIISCGEKNSYGHPHKEVIFNLESLHIPYTRTDTEGTICLYC
jgi:competence protein ComEC